MAIALLLPALQLCLCLACGTCSFLYFLSVWLSGRLFRAVLLLSLMLMLSLFRLSIILLVSLEKINEKCLKTCV